MALESLAQIVRSAALPCTGPHHVLEALNKRLDGRISYDDLEKEVPGGTSLYMVILSLRDQGFVTINEDWKNLSDIIVTLNKESVT